MHRFNKKYDPGAPVFRLLMRALSLSLVFSLFLTGCAFIRNTDDISESEPGDTETSETEPATETAPEPEQALPEESESGTDAKPGSSLEREEVSPAPRTPRPTEEPSEVPSPAPEESPGDLEREVTALLENQPDAWAVLVRTLGAGGEDFSVYHGATDADTPMIAASIIKLWVMAAVFEQAGGEPDEIESALLFQMITVSDNYACNRLITETLGHGDPQEGMAAVNACAQRMGCLHTTLNRLMLDTSGGLENYTTVEDCALILERIHSGTLVSPEASAAMEELLFAQERCNKIPAGLPAGTRVGNKTGELSFLAESDVALVCTEKGDYLLCVMCMNPVNNMSAIGLIVQISTLTYEHFTASS